MHFCNIINPSTSPFVTTRNSAHPDLFPPIPRPSLVAPAHPDCPHKEKMVGSSGAHSARYRPAGGSNSVFALSKYFRGDSQALSATFQLFTIDMCNENEKLNNCNSNVNSINTESLMILPFLRWRRPYRPQMTLNAPGRDSPSPIVHPHPGWYHEISQKKHRWHCKGLAPSLSIILPRLIPRNQNIQECPREPDPVAKPQDSDYARDNWLAWGNGVRNREVRS
ncbi:hypothetical protein EV421DRAFT_1977588 [Armillaria borealis]|uniref:Uncharacterized protein n=1 Tax=Armillaria borealis TaxID=47425 RepID=A0AA39K4A2_9AGAR|nr:hypothetical protein EV421DRAFT_1977588 [Armillaria borealis]